MIPPRVTVIVTHHLTENQAYLDLCLESLLASTYPNFKVMLMSDATEPPRYPNDSRIELIYGTELGNASQKVRYATQHAPSDTELFLFCGDDVIVSKYTISDLASVAGKMPIILNPMSNNDIGSRFILTQASNIQDLKPQYDLGEVNSKAVQQVSPANSVVALTDYVSFYCTMMHRKVWEAVGSLDEKLDYRHNDQDFCMRAKRLGIPSGIHFGAFALHYGSKTLTKLPGIQADQQAATDHFIKKWNLG